MLYVVRLDGPHAPVTADAPSCRYVACKHGISATRRELCDNMHAVRLDGPHAPVMADAPSCRYVTCRFDSISSHSTGVL
jgi:hypothetical protein